MNKVIIAGVVVILAIGGYFFFMNGDTDEQVVEDDVMMEDDSTMVEDDAAMQDDTMVEDDTMMEEDTMDSVKVFTVDSFSFGYSVEEIRVNKGDTVRIELTNSDGFHDWVVDEFDAATEQIKVGETTFVEFVADQAGEFEFYCSVGEHRAQGMVGMLIVEDTAE